LAEWLTSGGLNLRVNLIKRAEWILAVALSLTVLFLLVVRATHAGPPWRDECAALNLAQMPTFADVARNFQHEAFPLLFPVTVRGYTAVFGSSDNSVRSFGFVVGVLFVFVAWFNSRAARTDPPLLLFGLFGLNATFLTWGTTLRGYGLGSVLILLALGLTVRCLIQPRWRNVFAALAASIASLHCLTANAPLLAAMSLAIVAVLLARHRYKEALVAVAITVVTVSSFLPFLKSYITADWTIVLQAPATISSLSQKLMLALGEPKLLMVALWGTAICGVMIAAALSLPALWRSHSTTQADVLAFLILFTCGAVLANYGFLKILSYPTRPWYYLAMMSAVCGAVDLMSGIVSPMRWIRIARLIFVTATLLVAPFVVWNAVTERQTNIDIVASTIQNESSSHDLVVINPWNFAISFQRYYHGRAPCVTVPEIADLKIHRYDLLKAKMTEQDPLTDVRAAIRQTLESGGRVWIVGGARPPEEGLPLFLPPAPHPDFGWNGMIYSNVWSMQLAAYLRAHVLEGDARLLPAKKGVNEYENVTLLVARGWLD
jgi:hypothetical protein